jgi:hypothetical protein
LNEHGTRMLAAAIVAQAVDDWRKADKMQESNPRYRYANDTKDEIESFFGSGWFDLLCEINPQFTRIRLKEERA